MSLPSLQLAEGAALSLDNSYYSGQLVGVQILERNDKKAQAILGKIVKPKGKY